MSCPPANTRTPRPQVPLRVPAALDHAICFKYNLCDPKNREARTSTCRVCERHQGLERPYTALMVHPSFIKYLRGRTSGTKYQQIVEEIKKLRCSSPPYYTKKA